MNKLLWWLLGAGFARRLGYVMPSMNCLKAHIHIGADAYLRLPKLVNSTPNFRHICSHSIIIIGNKP